MAGGRRHAPRHTARVAQRAPSRPPRRRARRPPPAARRLPVRGRPRAGVGVGACRRGAAANQKSSDSGERGTLACQPAGLRGATLGRAPRHGDGCPGTDRSAGAGGRGARAVISGEGRAVECRSGWRVACVRARSIRRGCSELARTKDARPRPTPLNVARSASCTYQRPAGRGERRRARRSREGGAGGEILRRRVVAGHVRSSTLCLRTLLRVATPYLTV